MVSKNTSKETIESPSSCCSSTCSSPQKIKKSKKTVGQSTNSASIPLTLTQVLPKQRKEYTIQQKREKWSDEEHDKFVEAIRIFGRDWKKVEEFITTKTRKQIRSHAQKHFEKMKKTGEEFPAPRAKKKSSKPYPSKKTNEIYNALSNEQIVSNLKNIPNEFFEKLIAQHDVTDAIRLIHLLVTTDSAKTFSEQERALIKTIIHNANILSEKQRQSSMSSETTNHLVFLLSIFTNFADLFESANNDKSNKTSSTTSPKPPKDDVSSHKKEQTIVKSEPINDWNTHTHPLVDDDLVQTCNQPQKQMDLSMSQAVTINNNALSSMFPHLNNMVRNQKSINNNNNHSVTPNSLDNLGSLLSSAEMDQYNQYCYNVTDNVSNASSFSVEERDSFSQTFDDAMFGINTMNNTMLNPLIATTGALCNPITICQPQQFMYIPTILLQPTQEHFCNFQTFPTNNTLYIPANSTSTTSTMMNQQQNFDHSSILSFFDQKDNEEHTDYSVNNIFDNY